MTSATPSRLGTTVALGAALLLAACASDEASSEATTAPSTATATASPTATETIEATPTTTATAQAAEPFTATDGMGNELTFDEVPGAIVSLSSTPTEMLFALGAGDQVVAVDEYSNYPPEAPTSALSGFTPNVEAIADYDPDLVVVSYDPDDLVAQLQALGIPVATMPAAASIDDAWVQIELLGEMTGNAEGASDLVEQLQDELETVVAMTPTPDEPLTYYHEVDSNLYTLSSNTFAGEVYGLFGLENIADEAAEAAENDYPQLQSETVVSADPHLIFIGAGTAPEDVAQRPGWNQITAVEAGNVVTLPDDIASRWGPRIVEFAQFVGDTIVAAQ